MKKKIRGEVTLEAAIVVPVLILVVISLLYFAFYVHDLLVLKSYAYSAGVEKVGCTLEEFSNDVKLKVGKAPVLIMSPVVDCYKENDDYVIEIKGRNTSTLKMLNNIMENETIEIKIQQSIKRDNMYAIRSVLDLADE